MKLRVICSRHTDECLEVLKEIGYDEAGITVCNSLEDIKAASEDAILIVDDYRLVTECGITALVECGVPVSSPARPNSSKGMFHTSCELSFRL